MVGSLQGHSTHSTLKVTEKTTQTCSDNNTNPKEKEPKHQTNITLLYAFATRSRHFRAAKRPHGLQRCTNQQLTEWLRWPKFLISMWHFLLCQKLYDCNMNDNASAKLLLSHTMPLPQQFLSLPLPWIALSVPINDVDATPMKPPELTTHTNLWQSTLAGYGYFEVVQYFGPFNKDILGMILKHHFFHYTSEVIDVYKAMVELGDSLLSKD